MRGDEDYSAWHKLKQISGSLTQMEQQRSEKMSRIEIAGKRCMAGILRASNMHRRNHVPYFRSLRLIFLIPTLSLFQGSVPAYCQSIEHHEAILLDVSGSIGGGSSQNQRFREYLYSAKKLLLTEPPNSRVWVSTITTESFGSVQELLKGRTPDAQGVFTDDLDRARRQLATSFESKSAGLAPVAAGTDIIGALWHMKTLLESTSGADSKRTSKTIWIVSDMMNETPGLLMPALIPLGPQKMLEHAKASGLIVPLQGYKIHVIGAATTGLSPQSWNTIKEFWTLYFRDAGAELASYSVECTVDRQ
jgi:hypothetical protein